jgi:hypothetical protein
VSNIFKSSKKEQQETQIDPRVYNEVLQNLQLARQISQIPFEPYRGMMVAPFTQDYMRGEQMTRDIAAQGGFVPEVEGAARQAQQLMSFQPQQAQAERVGTQFTPQQVAAQQLATTFGARDVGGALAGGPERVAAERLGTTFGARDITGPGAAPTVQAASLLGPQGGSSIADYMNPYQQGVIDVGLSDIERADDLARRQRSQRATAARAFGGSRAAVEEGIAAGEAARERNRFLAEQRAQGFQQAAALREADVGRQQQTALANQAAAQETMRLAQAGQISNQERDLRLQQLGLTAAQSNQAAAMEAARANQQAVQQYMQMGLSAEEANQRANLDAQRLGLTAGQANQEAAMRAALANQQAGLEAGRMGLTAQQANQEAALRAQLANQQAGLSGAQFQLGAGRQFADLGQQALQNRYGAAGAMTGIGAAQQQLMQQYLNAQQQEFMRRTQYPMQQLAVAQGAVAASPYNQTQYGTTQGRQSLWDVVGNVFSDERMKYNVKPIKNPLDKVNRMEGVTYRWKDDDDMDAGVIAQDVERAMPEAVSMDDETGMRKVSVPQMVGVLTEAVKELDAKVEGKKKRGKRNG